MCLAGCVCVGLGEVWVRYRVKRRSGLPFVAASERKSGGNSPPNLFRKARDSSCRCLGGLAGLRPLNLAICAESTPACPAELLNGEGQSPFPGNSNDVTFFRQDKKVRKLVCLFLCCT